MHPKGAKRNIVDQAIFSNDGPNLKSPEATSIPSVIPKIYKLKKSKAKGKPKSNKIFQRVERLIILLEPNQLEL